MAWFRKNYSGILMSFVLALVAAWIGNVPPDYRWPRFWYYYWNNHNTVVSIGIQLITGQI